MRASLGIAFLVVAALAAGCGAEDDSSDPVHSEGPSPQVPDSPTAGFIGACTNSSAHRAGDDACLPPVLTTPTSGTVSTATE